jgi:hypothetical protein
MLMEIRLFLRRRRSLPIYKVYTPPAAVIILLVLYGILYGTRALQDYTLIVYLTL